MRLELTIGLRPLLTDPGEGLVFIWSRGQPWPTHPPTTHQKNVPQGKMEFSKEDQSGDRF